MGVLLHPSPPQPTSAVGEKRRSHSEQSIKRVMTPRGQLIVTTIRCGQAGHAEHMPWTVSGHISLHSLSLYIMHPMHARAKCESHPCIPAILSRGARMGAAVNTESSACCSHRVESRACRHRAQMAQKSQFSRVPPHTLRNFMFRLRPEREVPGTVGLTWRRTLVSRGCRKEQDRTGALDLGRGVGHSASEHGEPPYVQPLDML